MVDYTRAVQAIQDLKKRPNHEVGAGLTTYVEDLANEGWPGYDQQEVDAILVFMTRFSNALAQ